MFNLACSRHFASVCWRFAAARSGVVRFVGRCAGAAWRGIGAEMEGGEGAAGAGAFRGGRGGRGSRGRAAVAHTYGLDGRRK